ncbi:MAG TPA: hypothetical protein VGO76_06390 [Luteibacter sp.]|jgi:hypothetical protein|nr:hypothetical protein [Luteibacter sp.]
MTRLRKTWLRQASCAAIIALACTQAGAVEPDGQHDFDFSIGHWKTHILRLQHPLAGSTQWIELNGKVETREVWNGRANLEEIDAKGPAGHVEGLTLRLYDPRSHQWNLTWSDSHDGTLGTPVVGGFRQGRGEFLDQETIDGKAILTRNVYSDITPDSYHFEQAYSDDGGRTWETNFKAVVTRDKE